MPSPKLGVTSLLKFCYSGGNFLISHCDLAFFPWWWVMLNIFHVLINHPYIFNDYLKKNFFFYFWLRHEACAILVPWPGMEASTVEVQSPNKWTTREFPMTIFSLLICRNSLCIVHTNPLLNMYTVNVSSKSVDCLFTLLMILMSKSFTFWCSLFYHVFFTL